MNRVRIEDLGNNRWRVQEETIYAPCERVALERYLGDGNHDMAIANHLNEKVDDQQRAQRHLENKSVGEA